MSGVNSPFKFLDSYQQSDADIFFGREKETLDLYNALSGVKHLLVYGPTGAGKTSLIECGLRNQFSDADWFAVTIRRGNNINAAVFTSINEVLNEKIEIELAHVQVFLRELWERAQLIKKSNKLPLLSGSLIKDSDNLEVILERFLKEQIADLESDYGKRVPLELLDVMITERFTKLQLSIADIKAGLERKKVVSKKLTTKLLDELKRRMIICTTKAEDEPRYEISQNVLALVVGQNRTEEMKIRKKAEDIYKVYQERTGFFTQDDIDFLRPFEQSLFC